MPSETLKSPQVQKGAFVQYKSTFSSNPDRTIKFLYNPEELSRKLNPSVEEITKKGSKEPLKIAYPPEEEISLKIILDATNYLETGEKNIYGIAPELSVLELLLYPIDMEDLHPAYMKKKKGSVKITPVEIPLVLFTWGEKRALPVNITSLSITEKAFDINLNPVRAEVDVSMKVLTWKELTEESMYEKYMWNLNQKKDLAVHR
jgi:hypothetical protein